MRTPTPRWRSSPGSTGAARRTRPSAWPRRFSAVTTWPDGRGWTGGRMRGKPRSRRNDPEAAFWLIVFTGLTFGYQFVLGWQGWYRLLAVLAATASTAVLLFAAGFVRGLSRDTRPSAPPELA